MSTPVLPLSPSSRRHVPPVAPIPSGVSSHFSSSPSPSPLQFPPPAISHLQICIRSTPAMAMPSSASDAESLFRTKKIPDIRAAEAATKFEIEHKKEELRQLVGKSYRDLIDSADTIVLMKISSESISSNLDSISASVKSLSASASPASFPGPAPNPARARVYGLASRVKYLVDTPESIWGCLDESMLLEASGRYLRAREVHNLIVGGSDRRDVMRRFPLLRHQWQIVESFKGQISQRSRERLMDQEVSVGAYADALAAAAMIDDLDPKQLLGVFLESRRSWISQKVAGVSISASRPDSVVSVLCDVARMIRLSLGQVGELFVQVLNDLPLFYKTVLGSPPGTQLYGGIPNPEEEVRRWRLLREKLESVTVMLEPEYVAQCASSCLKGCCDEIFGVIVGGKHLIDAIGNGEGLGVAEKLVRETLDDRESLDGSLEQWLRSVFGSEIESPWDQIRGLILKDGKDIFESTLEEALVKRMKEIVHLGFQELSKDVNVGESIQAIVADPGGSSDFQAYLRAPSTGGGVWFSEPNHRKAAIGYGLKPSVDENDFRNCLNAYFGPEVGRIRDAVDIRCGMILEDLLSFMESHNSALRLKDLAPYLQEKCYQTISSILQGLEDLLGQLSASLGSSKGEDNPQPPSIIVKRSLFIGRLLFAFRNHSIHIPLILGSPKQWVKDTGTALFGNLQQSMLRHSKVGFDSFGPQSPRRQSLDSPRSPRRQFFDNPRRQTISTAAALFPADDSFKPKFDEHCKTLRELCIKAHSIWISWVSDELSIILSEELHKDDALFATAPLKGWEVTTIKQEDSSEGPLEMKIALPFMPSLYISSFLFQACQEIHRIGGHVLDKLILQNFAWKLFEKMVTIYQSFLSEMDAHVPYVSDKGILQILLDLRFAADILSGGKDSSSPDLDLNLKEDPSRVPMLKSPYRQRQSQLQPDSAVMEHIMGLIHTLSQKLDPIDWAVYESYLWENERQSYKRYAVLFGFLVQLNRMYTDTVQKLPTKSNTESNILRYSTVPRFKYLPISAPALSSRGTHKSSLLISSDASPRSPWNRYSTGEQTLKQDFDEDSGFDVATPLLKSFMTQVGSKFGESTSRLGFMLTDAQVGKFRDRSAAAMSTFGDMLPGPAAGLLSSFTAGVGRSDI